MATTDLLDDVVDIRRRLGHRARVELAAPAPGDRGH